MEGSCHVPIACSGSLTGSTLTLTGVVADLEGSLCIRQVLQGLQEEAEQLGKQLADNIINAGGREILEKIKYDQIK